MCLIARTVVHCNSRRIMFLRLYKRSYSTITTNYSWTLNEVRRFPVNYKYFLPSHRHRSIMVNTISENDFVKEQHPEHKVVHSIFENSIFYENTILPPIKTSAIVSPTEVDELYATDWSCESSQKIFNAIKILSYCYLNGSRLELSLYQSILQAYTTKLSELKDHEVKLSLQHIIVLQDIIKVTNVWNKLLSALNKECLKRFFPSKSEEMLLISDAFYQLHDNSSDYVWRVIRKFCSKVNKISAKALVQMLFYSNSYNFKFNMNMFEIECAIEECIHELSGNELGIVARSFFLAKRSLKSKTLISIIMKKVNQSIQTMDSTAIASVMKLMRYSECTHCRHLFQDLLISLRDQVPRLPLICLTHISHAFGGIHVYDQILTDKILERVKDEIKGARLKDIERVIFGICTVAPLTNYYTDVCHELLNEVISSYKTYRSVESDKYSLSLLRIVVFLTIRNIYVPELIQHVLDPAFVQKTYRNNLKLLSNELLILQLSVQIELPNYEGPFLKENVYKYLVEKLTFHESIYKSHIKLWTEIVFICKNKFGLSVFVDYILPHYLTKDIVFGIDEHNNAVEVEPILSAIPTGLIKNVNSDELKKIKWIVLCILPTSITILGHDGYSGHTYRKFRQFKTLGYTPIPICEQKWYSYDQEEEKENYLRQLIYEESNRDFLT